MNCLAELTKNEVAVGVCYPCEKKLSPSEIEELKVSSQDRLREEELRIAQQKEEMRLNAAHATKSKAEMLLTTETYPSGLVITDRLEIVTAECVYGMNIFKEFMAGITDLVGGRSATTQKLFRDARKAVLQELREEAFSVGANAVIGVNIQYSQLSAKETAMLMVTATGTAVQISNK